jgi:cysteine-rich repeat protein
MHRANRSTTASNASGSKAVRRWRAAAVLIAAVVLAVVGSSCLFGTTTNLCEQSGRRCRFGQQCAANQDACIDIGGCGDGIVDSARNEVCDFGDIRDGDGCSFDCRSTEVCGNDIIDTAVEEDCDDNNTRDGDGCAANCRLERCGNGVLNINEVCDDGNITPDDGCSARCDSNEACGNGFLDSDGVLREECEFADAPFPRPTADTAACDSDCTLPRCGDGHHNALRRVPELGRPEDCDTGSDTPSCDADCTFVRCGDGYPNLSIEECDKGTQNSNTQRDACRLDCRRAHCGDGVRDSGEDCDPNGCSSSQNCSGCRCVTPPPE